MSSTRTKTLTIQKVKAKNMANQAGLDRLQDLYLKATSNPNAGQNYGVTIKRAIKSLQQCPHPILTQKEALTLKFVGPAMARKICPTTQTKTCKRKRNESNDCQPRKVCPVPASSQQSFTKSSSKETAYQNTKAKAEKLILGKGPWKVILLVDIREHRSKQVVSSCKQAGIPCEERQLAIGDMAWIARCIRPTGETSQKNETIEILLGTIVERKEVSDLASSLFGTRYSEQRLRLFQSGLPQVLFLVEGNLNSLSNCPSDTLQMAMMETRLHLGFKIVHTQNLVETVGILKTLHSRIVQRTFPITFETTALPTFGGRGRDKRRRSSLLELVFDTPPVPPFGQARFVTYEELKAKVEVDRERGTKSVRALTLAMLKQIPTLSNKKCTAIAHHYPTMNALLKRLVYPTFPQPPLKDIRLEGKRTLGPISAAAVHKAVCTLSDGRLVSLESTKNTAVLGPQKAQSASAILLSKPSKDVIAPMKASAKKNTTKPKDVIPAIPAQPSKSATASAMLLSKPSKDPIQLMSAQSNQSAPSLWVNPETVDLLTPESTPQRQSIRPQAPGLLEISSNASIRKFTSTTMNRKQGLSMATTSHFTMAHTLQSPPGSASTQDTCMDRKLPAKLHKKDAQKGANPTSSQTRSLPPTPGSLSSSSSSCYYSSPDANNMSLFSCNSPQQKLCQSKATRNDSLVVSLLDEDDLGSTNASLGANNSTLSATANCAAKATSDDDDDDSDVVVLEGAHPNVTMRKRVAAKNPLTSPENNSNGFEVQSPHPNLGIGLRERLRAIHGQDVIEIDDEENDLRTI